MGWRPGTINIVVIVRGYLTKAIDIVPSIHYDANEIEKLFRCSGLQR